VLTLDVWSDYNCPWCFLASLSVARLQENRPLTVRWRSYELRPKGSPPISESYRQRIEQMRPRLYAIAQEQFGVAMNPGPFGVDSRPALVGAKFAEEHGRGAAYHDAVMRAYWVEARSIEDAAVLSEIAEAVGLEPNAFLHSLTSADYQALVDADILTAQQMELSGVPALLFERKYLIAGAQPYEELVKAYDYVVRREHLDR
jgi:predicted DsbA family dithiol-disulfide isomerase